MGFHGQVAGCVGRSGSRARSQRRLRVLLSLPLSMLIGACESPVTPAAVPTSLLARARISQFGAPGEASFAPLQVLVWDQFGLPMKEVLVRFTASHGTLERTEVLSDSSGLASPGAWTLRSTEGEDVVTATIDGVEPLRFRSRVRVPIEVAHYSLESVDGRTVPFEYPWGSVVSSGSLSFYQDGTWLSRVTGRGTTGAPYTGQMQGSYDLVGQTVTGSEMIERYGWQLNATISGNRLSAAFTDRVDGWTEAHLKVRSAPSWP